MVSVVYVGDADEVVTPANGGVPVKRGDVIELDDLAAGALVGYGDGPWQFAPAPKSAPAPVASAPDATEGN